MATAIEFPEADGVEDYPSPAKSRPLPVKRFPRSTVSCWQLSSEEQQEISQTGKIWLTTRTFRQLDDAPSGERWQPDVSITPMKGIALVGWGDVAEAPGSDRIVGFNENDPEVVEAREALNVLATQLKLGNDLGDMDAMTVAEALREVMFLEQAFACEGLRTSWIMPIATNSLRYIAKSAADALVGELALKALKAITKLLLGA